MRGLKKISAVIFLGAYLFLGIGVAAPKSALAEVNFTPQIPIPGSEFQQAGTRVGGTTTNEKGETVMRSDLLARYISSFYNWGLSIVGVIAVLTLMAGGLMWLTSQGDSGSIGKAKKMIGGSLIGVTLLVGSWLLLNTINPNLVNMPSIDMAYIGKVEMGCCTEDGRSKMTTSNDCKGAFDKNEILNSMGECEKKVCCISKFSLYSHDMHYCFSSLSTNCSAQKANQECSEVAECKDQYSITLSCAGVENGKIAEGYTKELGNPFFCYNGNVYNDKGKQGEPCGMKGDNDYGVCIKKSETCSDENNFGGRFCESSLKCCLDSGMW